MTFDTSYQKTALFRGTPMRSAVIRHDRHLIRALPLPMANPIFWGSAPAMPSPFSSWSYAPQAKPSPCKTLSQINPHRIYLRLRLHITRDVRLTPLRITFPIPDTIPKSSKAVPSRQDQVHPFALSLTDVPQYLSVIVLSFRRYAHCHMP